jgi:hypothetical protein
MNNSVGLQGAVSTVIRKANVECRRTSLLEQSLEIGKKPFGGRWMLVLRRDKLRDQRDGRMGAGKTTNV